MQYAMNVGRDGFCIMELARISFKDVRPISEPTSASESNNSQFTRLPRDFEISLSEANDSLQIQCLITLRDYASQPEEFYSSLSKEQWLRTVVNCESKGALLVCSGDFSENDLRDLTIQCNVVPCEPYWEKLQHARSSQDNIAGATSKGVYFPSSSLENHVFQLTRDDQQEYNVLEDWIERYDNEMKDGGRGPGRLHENPIKPSDGDLKRKPLSSGDDDPGRFRREFWKGGRFGVKVFKEFEKNTFLKEVEILEAIGTHKHIVYSFGVSTPEGKDGSYKYWMENLDGNLYDLIIELVRSRQDLPFSVIDSMDILLQIAKAMTRLHELNVIHGDLKSDNILVSHCEVLGDVKLYIVKVADFDKAEIVKSDDEVVHMTGTDEYIAPEALKARESGTLMSGSNAKKCDVYSFGIVAFEVLSGQSSKGIQTEDFDRDRRDDIMAPLEAIAIYHICPDLIDLVARCLNHDSSLRPSFAEVTKELEYVIGDVSN